VRHLLCKNDPKAYEFFNQHLIHLHVPEGATPKDGPSAGITMALALYSLAVGKPVKGKLAMTGELTLTGKVLPIGGVREKVIAARRLKVMELILPKDNERDFVKLPDYIKAGVKVHFADWFPDVLRFAFADKIPLTIGAEFKPLAPSNATQPEAATLVSTPAPTPAPVHTDAPKRRGRPPKSVVVQKVVAKAKKRGRPFKVKPETVAPATTKRRPGRPPKSR
jgi:hypothetical protein